MGVNDVIIQLGQNKAVFEQLLEGVSKADYLWRPKPEKWCLLEIVCHLLDEEIYDFKARVKHALEYPQKELVPIDPEGWVVSRGYISKNYNDTLLQFLNEREASITWLKEQQYHAKWSNALHHPELEVLSAELFLRNWLVHDYLHLRQILRYKFALLQQSSTIDLSYAGNW
ncbi:DinB family protein [Flavobacteriaceae bacterium MHTCC 0001]